MAERTSNELPPRLLEFLMQGMPALLMSLGEDGYPGTAFTWAIALGSTNLRFAADHGSATLANLERTPRASLQVIASDNLVYLIKGGVRQARARIEAAPFQVALMELQVSEVKDQSWPGVRVSPLAYEWEPAVREEMQAMEQAVYAEMKT